MKMLGTTVAIIALLLTNASWAEEKDQANEIAEPWAAEQVTREVRQARLDSLMEDMAEEMQAIRSTKNRKEREALMATHRENMREAMSLMRGMGGVHMRKVMAAHMGPGSGPNVDSDRPRHQHKRTSPARPRAQMSDSQRLADLENRLDMMQVMMESMMNDHGNN